MTRIIIQGDTHGRASPLYRADIAAKTFGADKIFIVGDFGLMGPYSRFLDEIDKYTNGIKVYALPGNHEDHDAWKMITDFNDKDEDGFAHLKHNIWLAPKVHKWTWDNKSFLSVGGAVSIDKEYRLYYEEIHGEKIWWANETTTDEDVVLAGTDKVDYLFTHDCSDLTPWKERLKDDPDSKINRQQIDKVIRAVRPDWHFFGHMHQYYEFENYMIHRGNHSTQARGMALENAKNACAIFDTATNEFQWFNLQ